MRYETAEERKQNPLTVGEKVRKAREYRSVTQKQLGAAIGYTDKSVSAFERNQNPVPEDLLPRIAGALRVKIPQWFTDGTDGPPPLGDPEPEPKVLTKENGNEIQGVLLETGAYRITFSITVERVQ